ncbi:MAG: hypothetical protein N2385_14555, partial [Chloroflexus sp.]|nr:hypothetical protein [Chloroflexus sp.]
MFFATRNGDVPAIGELRTQLARDLMTQIASNVFNRLSTIWNEADVPDLHDTGTALTKTALDTLIANVEQRAPVRAIVGTKEALRPLFTFAGYVTVGSTPLAIPRQLQEYGDTGMVREYLGIPVVILPQVMANTLPNPSKKLVRSDIVLVIGQEAGVIGLKGEMQTQEHIDTSVQPADYYLHVWQHYGIAITARERVGMFRIV